MTTKTDTEQERAEFETWYGAEFAEDISDSTFIYYENCNQYQRPYVDRMWQAYQAGRAALQSQDREDAERFRFLRDNAQLFSHFGDIGNSGWCVMRRDHTIRRVFTYNGKELVEAIDHARRIEE